MFNDLDKSPLNDSSGLKFVEYLHNRFAGGNNNKGVPRSRKQLFAGLRPSDTTDEFSIRKIAEKENTVVVATPAPSPRKTPSRKDSSAFLPGCVSTPMVPTTVNTPFRATRKSIGTQKTPPEEVPLSQEPEIPETPEVVVAAVETRRITQPAAALPVIEEDADMPPPPPPEPSEPERMYPDLENVGQQQQALPMVVIPAPAAIETVAPPPVVHEQPPAQETIVVAAVPEQIVAPPINSPPPPPVIEATPVKTLRRSIRVISPERLMAIIHRNNDVTEDGAEEVPETQEIPESPLSVPATQIVHTPRRLVSEMVEMPPPAAKTPTKTTAKTPAKTPVRVPETPASPARQFDDSSRFAVPTPNIRNFKLVVADCLKTHSAVKKDTREPRQSTTQPKPPTTRRPSQTAGKNKMHRASELTIPKDSRRSSVVVPSSQKRRLHSTIRELTPIRSPVPSNMSNRGHEVEPAIENTTVAPIDNNPDDGGDSHDETVEENAKQEKQPAKRRRGRAKAVATEEKKAATKKAGPKSRKTQVVLDSEEDVQVETQASSSSNEQPESSSTARKVSSSDESPPIEEEEVRSKRPGPKSKTKMSAVRETMEQPQVLVSMLNDWASEPEQSTSAPATVTTQPEEVTPELVPISETDAMMEKPSSAPTASTSDDAALFKKPKLPAPRKKRTKVTVDVDHSKDADADVTNDANGTRRSGRTVKPVCEVVPFYMQDKVTQSTRSINYCPKFKDYCKEVIASSYVKPKAKAPVKKPAQVLKDVGNRRDESSSSGSSSSTSEATTKKSSGKVTEAEKRSKTSSKEPTKKKKKVANDEDFNALRDAPEVIPVIEEEPDVPMTEPVETPRTIKPRVERRRLRADTKSTSSGSVAGSSMSVFQGNFSNMPQSCSTGVDWSNTQSTMVTITRTLDMNSFATDTDERVRRQVFEGGQIMTYAGYSRGIILLETKKDRARVKQRPLVLNIVSGTVIVNLLTEKRAVRLTDLDEISIPVGMAYSLENIGDSDAVLMFSW